MGAEQGHAPAPTLPWTTHMNAIESLASVQQRRLYVSQHEEQCYAWPSLEGHAQHFWRQGPNSAAPMRCLSAAGRKYAAAESVATALSSVHTKSTAETKHAFREASQNAILWSADGSFDATSSTGCKPACCKWLGCPTGNAGFARCRC